MDEPTTAAPELIEAHHGDETHLLREVMRTHQALLAAFSREVGVPAARLGLMRLLAVHAAEQLGPMELARRLGVNAAAVTRQVQELEAEGLVVRRTDPRDGRRRYVALGEAGLAAFLGYHERSHAFEQALAGSLSAEDLATTARVLAHVRGLLEGTRRES